MIVSDQAVTIKTNLQDDGSYSNGLFPLPDSDSDSDSDMDFCTMQDFSIGSVSDPLIEMYIVGMEIYPLNLTLNVPMSSF